MYYLQTIPAKKLYFPTSAMYYLLIFDRLMLFVRNYGNTRIYLFRHLFLKIVVYAVQFHNN
jgi:hypothetical protein